MEENVEATWIGNIILTESNDLTRDLYDKSRYGEPIEKQFQYSLLEALYLLERQKFIVKSGRNILNYEQFLKKSLKLEPNFKIRYSVFKDLRKRGYIVKTALKFGADFRVYERGVKPGEDHAKWVVYPISEGETLTWYDFAAKNRVAHSTKKRLLLGIVDVEDCVTYYEVKWIKP
ncbi:tRNA-intron lyase [Candidatus Woesearchaeota archaeon]|nr:tRNA-intron lyase [Candidatus Woesearchaeota archaeon]